MEYLYNGYTLTICPGAFPVSTDSMALAAFASLSKKAKVLDLGSGCGTLGLLLCAKDAHCHVTGVELHQDAHLTALDNICRNQLSGRMESICADLRTLPRLFSPGAFQVCVSNPPYFAAGPQSVKTPHARREDHCTLEELCSAAAWALQYGGDFFLVHRPERLAEICAIGAAHQLEPKRLRLLRHKEGGPVSLILVQLRKGGKPGLLWEEDSLYDPNGEPTAYYQSIYHL